MQEEEWLLIFIYQIKLLKISRESFIYKINIDVEKNFQKQVLGKIKSLTDKDNEITRISKIEQQEMMHDAKMAMYILGGGVAMILALIE